MSVQVDPPGELPEQIPSETLKLNEFSDELNAEAEDVLDYQEL